jgi:hypothetical protein
MATFTLLIDKKEYAYCARHECPILSRVEEVICKSSKVARMRVIGGAPGISNAVKVPSHYQKLKRKCHGH